jgi:hypothetical protein
MTGILNYEELKVLKGLDKIKEVTGKRNVFRMFKKM